MKYRDILLDADGTLFDFHQAEYDALADTLKHFSLPQSREIHEGYSLANGEQWKLLEKKLVTREQLRTNRFKNFCQKFGFSCSCEEMATYYENALSTKGALLEGAEEICRLLSLHCDLYIVTNGFRHIQQGRFGTSPLSKYIKSFFISEEIGPEKPDPIFFERVADRIPGFAKETSLIVGDSLSSDIAGGIAFGIDTCWFNSKGDVSPGNMRPTYIISSLSQLQNIILRGE